MKQVLFILLLFTLSCSMPSRFSNQLTPEEKGYNCLYSFFSVKNITGQPIKVVIDNQIHTVEKGKKLKQRLLKGKHNLCVNGICEDDFRFYPCMDYDFTPSLY